MKVSKNIMRNRSKRRCFSWSNLPGKIIFKISKTLRTRNDIVRFRQVCSKWRKCSLTPPQNLLSFNNPLPQTIYKALPFQNSKKTLVLRVSNVYLISPSRNDSNDQSFKPWMVMAEELNPGNIKLRHALTAKRVKDFPRFLDMTRFETLELVQGYNFKSSNCVHKVLLCSNSASSIEVLVLYYKGVLGKLSLDVLGSGSDVDDENITEDSDEVSYSWENLKVRQGAHGGSYQFLYLDDVARFKDKSCGVDRKGRLYMLDTESMMVARAIVVVFEPICPDHNPSRRRKRLVVDPASGELYLVVRENIQAARKVRFKVYKLNEEGKRWDLVKNIGNERVLFVGIDHCFFAMAKHFPGCDGNSIVFASNCFTRYDGIDTPDGTLFDDEGIEVGVYHLGQGDNFTLLSSACPEFAEVIWPPPTWFSTREWNGVQTEKEHESSDKAGNSSFASPSDNHAEGLLSGTSSSENESSSEENTDDDVVMLSDTSDEDYVDEDEHESEEMESNCSGSVDPNPSNKSERAHSRNSDASNANFSDQIGKEHSDAREQPVEHSDAQKQRANEHSNAQKQPVNENSDAQEQPVEHSDPREQPVNEHFALPLLGLKERSKGSVRRDDRTQKEDFMEMKVFHGNRTTVTPSFSSVLPVNERFVLPLLGMEERGERKDDQIHQEVAEEKVFAANRMPVTPSFSSPTERSSTVKFQGVEIRSELLPTLRTIWAKHGNLIGENTIRSKKMLACALEELAELIITLNNTTGRTLTESETDDMRSSLSDLKCAGLKLDWLEPFIEHAIAVRNSKKIIESIEALKKRKAKVEEDERVFLAQNAKVKQELEESEACLRTRIPFPEDQIIDLDDCLGAGI